MLRPFSVAIHCVLSSLGKKQWANPLKSELIRGLWEECGAGVNLCESASVVDD